MHCSHVSTPKYGVNRLFSFGVTFAPVFSQSGPALLGYHGQGGGGGGGVLPKISDSYVRPRSGADPGYVKRGPEIQKEGAG